MSAAIVSNSYVVLPQNGGFAGHFAPLQPQPADQSLPRKRALYDQPVSGSLHFARVCVRVCVCGCVCVCVCVGV